MHLRYLLAILLLVAALSALAADSVNAPTVNNMSVQQFLAFHDGVARKAGTSEFDALSRIERNQLAQAQAELRAALAGKTSMDQLDNAGKLHVFNAHEKVVALVNKAEGERMVCVQRKRLGSHRHTLECRTMAKIREDREAARGERMRNRTCDSRFGSCGG